MANPFRLVLRKVEMTPLEDNRCRFLIWLAGRGEIYTGEAVSADDEESQLEAVVIATLQAVNKALRKPVDMKMIYSKQIFLAEVAKVVYLVFIHVGDSQNPKLLPGICLFTVLTPEIAARAALNALNRTISRLA